MCTTRFPGFSSFSRTGTNSVFKQCVGSSLIFNSGQAIQKPLNTAIETKHGILKVAFRDSGEETIQGSTYQTERVRFAGTW